jgi:hypothetical protein
VVDRFDSLAAMPDVFWIGLVIFGACLVLSFLVGVKSHTTATLTAVTIGAYIGLMAGFPLLALGLATS